MYSLVMFSIGVGNILTNFKRAYYNITIVPIAIVHITIVPITIVPIFITLVTDIADFDV